MFTIRLVIIVALFLNLRLDSVAENDKTDADASVHYVEAAKALEPLDVKKAIDDATVFFDKKYHGSKGYFTQKIEYDLWGKKHHAWEITFHTTMGEMVLGAPFSVTLLVAPDEKVSIESENYVTL